MRHFHETNPSLSQHFCYPFPKNRVAPFCSPAILKPFNILLVALRMRSLYTFVLNSTSDRELYGHVMAKFELLKAALMRTLACGMTPYILVFVSTYQSTRHHIPEY